MRRQLSPAAHFLGKSRSTNSDSAGVDSHKTEQPFIGSHVDKKPDAVGRPMEILMVEDSITDARLAIEALRRGKVVHRMSMTRDGEEALQFLRREGIYARVPRPDLVLLDIGLPKMDGQELLKTVKLDGNLREIPFVILTQSDVHEEALRDQLPNADCYMRKPLNLERFLKVIGQLRAHWLSDVKLP